MDPEVDSGVYSVDGEAALASPPLSFSDTLEINAGGGAFDATGGPFDATIGAFDLGRFTVTPLADNLRVNDGYLSIEALLQSIQVNGGCDTTEKRYADCSAFAIASRDFHCSYSDRSGNETPTTPMANSLPRSHTPPAGRITRCTSVRSALKSSQSPGRKKMVRFADAMGLDLEQIRHIVLPTLDDSSYWHDVNHPQPRARVSMDEWPVERPRAHRMPRGAAVARHLVACFTLDYSTPAVERALRDRSVCLEQVTVADFCVTGLVRVANLAFQKEVHARYSLDGWASWAEVRACYVAGSSDGGSDKFVFTLFLPHDLPAKARVELAVRLAAAGRVCWDSNGGRNYALDCVAHQSQPPCSNNGLLFDQGWAHFL